MELQAAVVVILVIDYPPSWVEGYEVFSTFSVNGLDNLSLKFNTLYVLVEVHTQMKVNENNRTGANHDVPLENTNNLCWEFPGKIREQQCVLERVGSYMLIQKNIAERKLAALFWQCISAHPIIQGSVEVQNIMDWWHQVINEGNYDCGHKSLIHGTGSHDSPQDHSSAFKITTWSDREESQSIEMPLWIQFTIFLFVCLFFLSFSVLLLLSYFFFKF